MRALARAGVDDISQRGTSPESGSLLETLVNLSVGETKVGAFTYAFAEANMRKGKTSFWPLPNISGRDSIFAFFKPQIKGAGEESVLVVHLVLLDASGSEKIAFRFEKEPQLNDDDRHHYLHAQLLPQISTAEIGSACISSSFFESCPGIPIPAIGPFGSWFAAVTSVAGHQVDEKNGLIRAFNDARDKYIGDDFEDAEQALREVIKRMLCDH
ncbi:MAG: hypothetical protein RIE24_21180 [Silicimonas sp.]|uniref:hypothetical protein n=1 Tax=Roseitalea porphyridii TaxID=1852022 RepID=UPI0032EF810A